MRDCWRNNAIPNDWDDYIVGDNKNLQFIDSVLSFKRSVVY